MEEDKKYFCAAPEVELVLDSLMLQKGWFWFNIGKKFSKSSSTLTFISSSTFISGSTMKPITKGSSRFSLAGDLQKEIWQVLFGDAIERIFLLIGGSWTTWFLRHHPTLWFCDSTGWMGSKVKTETRCKEGDTHLEQKKKKSNLYTYTSVSE